jgi:hypothetical protein
MSSNSVMTASFVVPLRVGIMVSGGQGKARFGCFYAIFQKDANSISCHN